nr:pol protein [Hymenolepis microstoma]
MTVGCPKASHLTCQTDYLNSFISNINYQNDSRLTFKFLGNLLNNKKKLKKEPIRLNNKLLATNSEIANTLVKFYSNKQKKNSFVRNSTRDIWKQVTKFDEIKENTAIPHQVLTESFSSRELSAAIKQLKCKKSPGEDSIHPEFLIRMGPKAKEVLLTLFNKIWEISLVPTQWKVAISNSNNKKGKDPSNFDNYRPISFTSMLAKLMERMVNTRLPWFLETNNTLGNEATKIKKHTLSAF